MKYLQIIWVSLAMAACGGGSGSADATTSSSTTTSSSALQFGNTTLGNAKFSE
jgi:hypothetical protein